MRISLPLAIAVLTIGLLVLVAAPAIAGASSASPAPTPTVTPSATPPPAPASAATVHWALRWKHAAHRARRGLCRVREAFGAHPPVRVAPAPKRAADGETWKQAGRRWRGQARDWDGKVRRGIQRMTHPQGSGAERWWPLAHYNGWPDRLRSWLIPIIARECHGDPDREDYLRSGHRGLMQLAREFYTGVWAIAGHVRHFNPYDPLKNLFFGWLIYRDNGPSPWAT